MGGKLAILACDGALPVQIVQAYPEAAVFTLAGVPHHMGAGTRAHSIEELGTLFAELKADDIERLVFAGSLNRPALDPAKFDATMLTIAPRLLAAMQNGDDALLRQVIEIFEEQGVTVVGAHELLPQLTAAEGLMIGAVPDADEQSDVNRAIEILKTLAPIDVGQGCVVAGGQCLGIETVQGTDSLLKFVAETPMEMRRGKKGVFVKAAKSGQDLRVDMPTIGPRTIAAVAGAGLAGIVIEAGRVMILDREKTLQAVENTGIFPCCAGAVMRVFLVAGEASGDRLGAALMTGLKSQIDVEFQGVGGPLMQAEGMQSLFPMDDLSVMGLAEILPKYPHLKRRLNQTVDAVLEARSDVLITIDSPDFCLRVARLVKAKSAIRTVHYVAPTVWAWRAGRAQKMAKVIDHVLALFPFEPPYMEAAGMDCDFVGHPVVSEKIASDTQVSEFKDKYGLTDAPVLLVLPGSRRGEVGLLAGIFGDALKGVIAKHPTLQVVIPTTATVTGMVQEAVENWPVSPIVLDPRNMSNEAYKIEKAASFRLADWALAASGTVSLELAATETPMVIAYDMNWVSRTVIARMLKVDTLTLVNLVSETRSVPECLGKDCCAEVITPKLLKVMQDPGDQIDAMRLTMERLGKGGEAPGLRAAKAVLDRMPGQ